ncbi:3 transmembrane region protein [Cryptosporidium felis]|nr:3 transmembrane region protein [Cryptosporidium felis]
MVIQNWILFDGVLLSWEFTPSQLFITLNCSSRSKRFLGFCVNGLKEIHGSFENVVRAVCHPSEKYDFLSNSCDDALAVTRYLNLVYLALLGSASMTILGVVFLMIYSRSFEVDKMKYSEVILKSKPRTGLAVTSILFNVLALLGVCFSSVLVIYTSQIVPSILAFTSDVPMFNIEPYGNSLGWGFYLLLLATSLLVVHILALVDSARMAKKLWSFSKEVEKCSPPGGSALVVKNANRAQDSFFVQGGRSQKAGSAFLPSPQTDGAIQLPFSAEEQTFTRYSPMTQIPQAQLHPRIASAPATKSVWGFFPISMLPRFNPYNSGMGWLAGGHGHLHGCGGGHGHAHHHHHHHHHLG